MTPYFAAAPEAAPPRLVPYDFRQPMTLPREHVRTLEAAFDTFARHWGTQVIARLRTTAQTRSTFESVQMCTYDEYISSLPTMTTLMVCAVTGGRRSAVLQIPLSATMEWIERMLGGRGKPGSVPDRELTDLEEQLLSYVMTGTLNDLGYSFASILPLEPELKRIQYSPQIIQVTTAATPVLVARFLLEVDGRPYPASVMLPVEEILAALRANQGAENLTAEELEAEQIQRDRMDLSVQEVPVDVSVRFRPMSVPSRELADLAVGDVLPLHQSAGQPLDVVVGDKILAQAAAGTSGSRVAGLIVNVKENS